MTTVRENWGMACPDCGADDALDIVALSWVTLVEDGTDSDTAFDGYEWNEESACRCGNCDWSGKVADLQNAGTAINELPGHCQIVPHGDGWRYLFEGDDDDDPLTFPTYLEAVEAANRIG